MATLTDLIFQTILRIDPFTISRYTTIQDQILYLILIPHVILFIFIFGFVRVVSEGHKGLSYLVGFVTYAFIILSGWYGSFLLNIFLTWWQIVLILGLLFFVGSKIVHPARVRELFNLGEKLTGMATQKVTRERELDKKIRVIDKQIQALETEAKRRRNAKLPTKVIEAEIADLLREKARLEAERE